MKSAKELVDASRVGGVIAAQEYSEQLAADLAAVADESNVRQLAGARHHVFVGAGWTVFLVETTP